MSSTVLLCADDPAARALARIGFADASWSVFECTTDEVAQVARTVAIDLVIVLGARATMIRTALGNEPPVIRVARPEHARDAAAVTLGKRRR